MVTKNNNKAQMSGISEVKTSGTAFSLLLVLFFALSMALSVLLIATKTTAPYPEWALYLQYLLPVVAIACASVWYFFKTQKTPSELLQSQRCHPKYYVVAILLQVGLLSLSELNVLFLTWLQKFGYTPQIPDLPSLNGFGFVGVLLTVAVLPAVFEEIFFRGVLLKGCKAFGEIGAALVCGGIFALYHQNPAQTIYQFCCGFAFALVAIRAGSVLPTVLSHFLNNALVIILTKFGLDNLSTPLGLVLLCVSALCLLGTLGYLLFLDKQKTEKPKGTKKEFLLGAFIGLVICAFTWISALFIG